MCFESGGEITQEKEEVRITEVRDHRLEEEIFQFKRKKLNHQVSQNNLKEEETSEEEDLFKEAEGEAEIMRLDVTHVERQDICHGIVQREMQDKEMFRLQKLRMNKDCSMMMLKFHRQEKPY